LCSYAARANPAKSGPKTPDRSHWRIRSSIFHIVGAALQRAAIGGDGGLQPALSGPDVAEVLGGLDDFGRGPQRRLKRGGAVEIHPPAQEQPQVVMRRGEIRFELDRAAEAGDGRFEFAALGVLVGRVALDCRGIRPKPARLAIAGRGAVRASRGPVRRAKGVVMVGLAAVEGDGPASSSTAA
jgi:hypothetical protein